MNAEDRVREAAKQLSIAADDADVSEIQAQAARNLAGIADALAESIEVLQDDPELVTDGGTVREDWPVGTRLVDRDNDDDGAEVWVVEQLDDTIDEHVVYETDEGTAETVYDYHRGEYDAAEPVVRCVYVESVLEAFPRAVQTNDGLGVDAILRTLRDLDVESVETDHGYVTVYAFPRGRLAAVQEGSDE